MGKAQKRKNVRLGIAIDAKRRRQAAIAEIARKTEEAAIAAETARVGVECAIIAAVEWRACIKSTPGTTRPDYPGSQIDKT